MVHKAFPLIFCRQFSAKPQHTELFEMVQFCRGIFALLSFSLVGGAPQGLIDGLSNLLTSVVGGSPRGEVDNYQAAPYNVVGKFNVNKNLTISQ